MVIFWRFNCLLFLFLEQYEQTEQAEFPPFAGGGGKGLFTQTKQSFFRVEEGKSFIISFFCAKIGVLAILLAVSIEEVACCKYLYHNIFIGRE